MSAVSPTKHVVSFPSSLPVHGDARQEEDGAVQVEVEEEPNKAAHEVPEDPAVPQHVAGHQEGQRQAVHQVSGGQVHHVDQGGVPPPPAAVGPARPEQDHRVQGQAEEEGEGVADGQEDVFVGLVDAAGRRGERGGGRGVGARYDGWRGTGSVLSHNDPLKITGVPGQECLLSL